MACISRFAAAILSGETELALGTVKVKRLIIGKRFGYKLTKMLVAAYYKFLFLNIIMPHLRK